MRLRSPTSVEGSTNVVLPLSKRHFVLVCVSCKVVIYADQCGCSGHVPAILGLCGGADAILKQWSCVKGSVKGRIFFYESWLASHVA